MSLFCCTIVFTEKELQFSQKRSILVAFLLSLCLSVTPEALRSDTNAATGHWLQRPDLAEALSERPLPDEQAHLSAKHDARQWRHKGEGDGRAPPATSFCPNEDRQATDEGHATKTVSDVDAPGDEHGRVK